ncbi:Holliday junction branch migration protein RuvA, partial [Escherichia coli]|nr:Holliday junction branch migration protein RuvA [Escherichia coli]
YLVGASSRTLAAIGPVGEAATLFTEMLVGEDFLRLVGFATAGERDWFRLLTGVQGVGARVALAILSALEPAELSRAVAAQDKAMVARANGVGPKLAERIVRELKDKVGAVATLGPAAASQIAPVGASADAVSALLNLGFRPAEAASA